jgi:hypothetical protein
MITARLEWKLEDVWVGAFWRRTYCTTDAGKKALATEIWICLLPCIPLHVTIWHRVEISK